MYILKEANPEKIVEKDYEAIIDFRKRFFYQNYANHPEPDFREWKNKIIRFYEQKKPKGFYSIYKNEKIIANLFHYNTDAFSANKVIIRIDYDKEAESTALAAIISEQINKYKANAPNALIESKEDFINKIVEKCGFYKGNTKEFAALNLSKRLTIPIKNWKKKGWKQEIIEAPKKAECVEIANIMTFLMNDMQGKTDQIVFKTTSKEIEKNFERLNEMNKKILYFFLRNENAKLIAYSFLSFDKSMPTIANQYMTGVLPEYRRQGLAKYVKSTFYDYLQKKHSQIKVILTDYYIGNQRIKNLNKAVGFQPEFIQQEWFFGEKANAMV